MTAQLLSKVLPDFAAIRETNPSRFALVPTVEKRDTPDDLATSATGVDQASPIASEEEIRMAFEAGQKDGQASAQTVHADEIANLSTRHEHELMLVRKSLSDEQALKFAEGLKQAILEIEKAFSTQISQLLFPLLQEKLENSAIKAFGEKVAAIVADGCTAEVRGPFHLIEPLHLQDALHGIEVSFTETDDDELSFSFGNKILETRIAPVIAELRAALE